MKKKILILVLAMVIALVFGLIALAADGDGTEAETITISYVRSRSTFDITASLDGNAYSNGKQVVGVGEKFTLPTNSSESNMGVEGYQLIWYTQDGQTYKAGQEVSFTEDTRLYRCNAKECYTAAELGVALSDQNPTRSGILMADMETNAAIGFDDWDTVVMIMNGFNLNFECNASGLIGNQRTQRHIYGEGTISAHNPDGKKGEYYLLNTHNHGYSGTNSRTVIGKDVTIDAPNYYLSGEGGDAVNHHVWSRVYGTVTCYGLFNTWSSGNRCPYYEFYEGCNITITGKQLFWDATSNGKFNYHAFDTAIYGGTFYLPAEAANQSFWTNDYLETTTNHDGTKTYTNVGLTQLTKDNIIIYGGSFVTADGSVPAIADYIANTYAGGWHTGGNGIITNNNTSTYEIPYYGRRPGIKLELTQYSATSLGTITVTDYVGSSLGGRTFKYTVNKLDDGTYEVVVYESRMDGETEVWDVVSDELAIKYGLGGVLMVSYDLTRQSLKLYDFEANNDIYQTVVPASCTHNFTGAPVDATCQSVAYADYNCSVCKHNVYFSWGEKAPHDYKSTATVAPTVSAHGSSSFECSVCKDTKTYATTMDPSTFDVTVTIKNDDGTTEEVTVLATDVFEFSTIGGNGAYIYTLTGIKAFGDYSIRNIYGVVIPSGIMYVRIETQNVEKHENVDKGLEVLEIADNSTITLHNIGNLSCLTTIKVGKGTNIVIEPSASYYNPNGEKRSTSKLTTLDFSEGDITAKVMSSAFQDRPISTLLLGNNSTYNFQYRSFRNTKITELKFPASGTFTFGTEAFYDADLTALKFSDGTAENTNTWSFGDYCFRYNPIESLTFGQYGTYTIGNTAFGNMKLAGTLTFAGNSTYTIGAWAFSNNTFTKIDASAQNITMTVNDSGLKDLTNVTEFLLGESSTYVFNSKSIGKTTYTKLVVPKNASVSFANNWLENNTTFAEVDASAENTTVIFNTSCFNGKTAFSTVKFGKNATLTFSEDCFKGTAVQGLTLPEGATITFNGYGLRNFAITELEIKSGSTVTFASNAFRDSTIEKLTLGSDSSYTFNNGSFNYTTKFTELIFPENCTVLFKDWTLNTGSTITKIDLSANNTTATFNASALRNSSKLVTLLVNGNNSSYTFAQEAVKGCANLEEIDISGENSTYNVTAHSAFADAPKLTELTFGKNSTYVIEQYLTNGSTAIAKLDASADGVNVTFKQNAFRGESSITQLLINGKNATYTFAGESFRDCSNIPEIVLGEGSTYTFNQNTFYSCNNITRVDASASNITATFGNEVFSGKSKIEYVAFGENGNFTFNYRAFYNTAPTNDVVFSNTSTFAIGRQAFYGTDFASITFEDNCDVTFTDVESFYGNDKATSLYIGKNIAITNYPFKGMKALETIYIMEGVTHASEFEFQNAGSSDFATPLTVYNHSYDFVFNRGLFDNCDGIFLYTVTDNIGTRTDVFTNCGDTNGFAAWTVYLGVSGPLVKGYIDPTCVDNGYDTYVCDCGKDCDFYLTETTAVNKYEKKHNITEATEYAAQTTYEVIVIEAAGHDTLGELLNIVYTSFLEKGNGTFVCTACGETHTAEGSVDPIFVFDGYASNAAKTEFAIGYRVDVDLLEKYEGFSGTTLVYGVIGAVTDNLNGKAPLEAEKEGALVINAFVPRDIAAFNLKIQGFSEEYYDLGITMSAYVYEIAEDDEGNTTETLTYMQTTATDAPASYTLGEYLNNPLPEAPIPGDDEEQAA